METADRKTVVGVFADRSHAEYAVEELRRGGFGPEDIGFVVPPGDDKVEGLSFQPGSTKAAEGAETGAAAGLAVGGLVGAALATAFLPGVGPVIAGGLLAGVLGGAAAGATGGSILGALIGMSVPEEEARLYEREFHSGRTLVTVQANGRAEEAEVIMQRAQEWTDPKAVDHHRWRLAELADETPQSVWGNPQT